MSDSDCHETKIVHLFDRLHLRAWPGLKQSFCFNRFRCNVLEVHYNIVRWLFDNGFTEFTQIMVDQAATKGVGFLTSTAN